MSLRASQGIITVMKYADQRGQLAICNSFEFKI